VSVDHVNSCVPESHAESSNCMSQEAPGPSPEITVLLREWQRGDRAALDRLIPLVYDELRLIASRYMARERRDGMLQTTARVNEA
jgi:hypothetical protein